MPVSSVDRTYAEHLRSAEAVWWKRYLDVQRIYRLHLRRLNLGFVLDVGCGIGRNLTNLGPGRAVGVDPNKDAIAICRERGLAAYTPDEFVTSEHAVPGRFDALLISHVLEHLDDIGATRLLGDYLAYVRRGGRVVLITPQEMGFERDPTHMTFVDLARLDTLARGVGLTTRSAYSFPFPRSVGRWFRYNEFVLIADKPR